MADDITRHLTTLPEDVIVKNMLSWEELIAQIEATLAKHSSKYWTAEKLEFIRTIAESVEARLFRAGLSKVYVTISTTRQRGLEHGDLFLRIIWNEDGIPMLEYCKFGKTSFQKFKLNTYDEPLFQMMPYLKRLWYESKTKREANDS